MPVEPPEPESDSSGPGEARPFNGRSNGSRPARPRAPSLASLDQRSLAEGDQTASETGQTLSEADHSASESDQTSVERDQAASDSDQAASDHDLASCVSQAAHEFSRGIRQRSTELCEQTPGDRLRTAERRDAVAHLRDLAALARDEAADARDLAMAQFEAAANRQERTPALTGVALVASAAEQRKRAAQHRAQAASYRLLAAQDREAAARNRQQAARERQEARNDREALAIELERAAVDTLTGAHTRAVGLREFDHELVRARRTNSPLVVAYIDVVELKAINDLQGHAAGDALLKDVVAGVKAHVRPYDLIIRLGGDEFLCVMSNLTLEAARDRFDSVATALNQAPSAGAIRTGFAQLRDHDTAAGLIARADEELIRRPRNSGGS